MKDRLKIVVGLELSQDGKSLTRGSMQAVDQARWFLEKHSGELILAHAKGKARYYEPVQGVVQMVHEGVPKEGLAAMEALVAELKGAGVEARFDLLDGKPELSLVRLVLSEQADFLVVGRHDAVEDGQRIGSVASKLLRKCPAPVWVVKPGFKANPERVLAATDRTPVGRHALELGADVASEAGAELHIVHAFQITMEQQIEGSDTPDKLRAQRDALAAEIDAELRKLTPDLEPHTHVMCTDPEHGILDAVNGVKPDLLVIGSVSRGGIAGFLIGNTAERVLPRTSCSLLVVKPDDFVCPVKL